MSKYTGSALVVTYNSSAWDANYVKSVNTSETAGVAETTGAGDSAATYLPTTENSTATLSLWDDTTEATVWGKVAEGTNSTLVIYPRGNVVGRPKLTCTTAIVTGRTSGIVYNEAVPVEVEIFCSGGMTEGTVT